MTPGSRRTDSGEPTETPARRREPGRGRPDRCAVARHPSRRGALVLALALLGLVAGGRPAWPVAAQDGGPPIVIEVVNQSTFVAADGTLWLDLAIEPAGVLGPDTGWQLAVTVYGLLDTETEMDEPLSQPLNRLAPIELATLPSDGPGRYRLEVPVRAGPQFDDVSRVLLPNPGVYPIALELRSDAGPVAATTTHLVRLPPVTSEDDAAGGVAAPVPVAIVLEVSTAEGLTVADVQRLLIDHPTIPITVVLGEGVEQLLRSDAELASTFAEALAGRPVLASPPLDLDPSALAEIGQADLYAEAATAARADLAKLGLTVADGTALTGPPLTEAGIGVLAASGIHTLLDTNGRAAGNAVLAAEAGRVRVIPIDRDLSRLLGGGTDGPHRANRVLARLTLRSLEDDAPVVIGGSALGVDPAPSVDAFLRALSQPGAPRPIPVAEVGGGSASRIPERPEQDLVPIADLLAEARADLAIYEVFFGGGGTGPEHYRQRMLASLTRERNPTDRRRSLELLVSQLADAMAVIELPDGQPVTLAARSASIPIAVRNTAGGPRSVLLRFDSDKVAPASDEHLVTIPPGTSSIDVEVEARSLGVSPLEVSVWTPDGTTLLADNRLEIRSTAVPGLGLLVTIGAVGLLLAWWIIDAGRRRAGRAGEDDDGDPPQPPIALDGDESDPADRPEGVLIS